MEGYSNIDKPHPGCEIEVLKLSRRIVSMNCNELNGRVNES